VENVPEPYPFLLKSVEDFTRFYEEIGEDISLVLDVGHANLNGQTERFLTVFRDKIVHMHVHDNDGKGDQHLGIGFGNIDWKNFVNALIRISYDRVVIIESVEQVAMSKHRLEELSA
jgi:sugar phosphate isomerase/epimerase